MTTTFESVAERVEELREAGFEPDRVVVPSDEWSEFKNNAEVRYDEEVFGGEATYVNGVRALHNSPLSNPRIMFEVAQ